jgi:hypothetical protein
MRQFVRFLFGVMTAIKPAPPAGFDGSGKAMIDYVEWDSGFSNVKAFADSS